MKCPKCSYTSFPYLESCRKCGRELTEVRELFGVYGLPPNPPDLMLAYDIPRTDAVGTPAVAVEQLEEIEIDLIDTEETAMSPSEEPPHADATFEIDPTFDPDVPPLSPLSPLRSETGQTDDKEPIVIDLSDLEGLTLELREVTEEEGATPLETPTPPTPAAADETIFEVDLEDEEELPACEPAAEDAGLDDDHDAPPREYVLEIEEELELEVEDGEEIELEEDDEAEEDDTHC